MTPEERYKRETGIDIYDDRRLIPIEAKQDEFIDWLKSENEYLWRRIKASENLISACLDDGLKVSEIESVIIKKNYDEWRLSIILPSSANPKSEG
jgi:hypothetical protein